MVFTTCPLVFTQNSFSICCPKAENVTENGRIVQTLLLPYENLVSLSAKPSNMPTPEFDVPQQADSFYQPKTQQWQSTYDWQPDYRFGYTADITRTYVDKETVQTPLANIETHKFIEKVTFSALGQQIENEFWVNTKGQVVKTIQYLGPDMTRLEMSVLKPYQSN